MPGRAGSWQAPDCRSGALALSLEVGPRAEVGIPLQTGRTVGKVSPDGQVLALLSEFPAEFPAGLLAGCALAR